MGRKAVVLLPNAEKILAQMGEQIRLARLRRDLSMFIRMPLNPCISFPCVLK